MTELSPDRDFQWAWDNYKPAIILATRHFGLKRLVEIGGGRNPLFDHAEIEAMGLDYTVGDISAAELGKAPSHVKKEQFDIAGEIATSHRYELAFSRMVMEHVTDGRRAYQNIFRLLESGGVVLSFYPTLYSPPFVINKMMPETLTRNVLRYFFPDRMDDETPKFPARYSWCYATERVERMVREVGFSEVVILPFYGHRYFQRIPLVRELDHALMVLASKHDFRPLSSIAFLIARK